MRNTLLLTACFFIISSAFSQVATSFDQGLENWRAEGDGDYSYDTNGNPGGCLRVDDDATGNFIFAVAPSAFHGDWSGATSTDSISFDLYVHPINGSYTSHDYVFEISGPSGTAEAISVLEPELDTWVSVSVKLDPDLWNQKSGNWNEMLSMVNSIRIRTEYIHGDEYVLLDNTALSFDPGISDQSQGACSSFERGNLDGWKFEEVASATITENGNPGNACIIEDKLSASSLTYPAPKFLGDWTRLNHGTISFDLKITSSSDEFITKDSIIKIAGPGGKAVIPASIEEISLAHNNWHTFTFPIEESSWSVPEGSWDELLKNITEMTLESEYIIGTETVILDNFCINPPVTTGVQDSDNSALGKVYPNPVTDKFSVSLPEKKNYSVQLINASGQVVLNNEYSDKEFSISAESLPKGVYYLKISAEDFMETRPIFKN